MLEYVSRSRHGTKQSQRTAIIRVNRYAPGVVHPHHATVHPDNKRSEVNERIEYYPDSYRKKTDISSRWQLLTSG
ncbi:hypothetical protein JTE90_015535 [Oedothorax gibbosus]|uniref:Uncharacterized protein n=1 Tax=Oedothorax gibbosus TaxID=931172 RepID=A0AAV6TP76_9ARAC|nr:hypothetical protein JTE90_015535 [Oedothorax gibbosus]